MSEHSQIICGECNDYLEGDRDICGVCADNLRMMLDEARTKLAEYESHGPEGHNVTNQQYVDLQAKNDLLRQVDAERIERLNRYAAEMRKLNAKLARYEAVVEAAQRWMQLCDEEHKYHEEGGQHFKNGYAKMSNAWETLRKALAALEVEK